MATETTNVKPPVPSKPSDGSGREPIAIKSLTFRGVESIQLPDGANVKSLHAGVKAGRPSYEIDLLPWMRQYRVTRLKELTRKKLEKGVETVETYYEPGQVFLIPESWALAELAL